MVKTYVLTRKLSHDVFICGAVNFFSPSVRPGGGWKSIYFATPNGKECYRAQRIFHGESPEDRRVIEFSTQENHKKEPIARDRAVLTPHLPVSRQAMREPCLTFVNAPIPWSEVCRAYPAALITGYAKNQQEEEILRDASGVNNAVFFRAPGYCTHTTDVLREFSSRRFLHALEDNCVAGSFTTDAAEQIAVEGLRRRLVRNVDVFKAAERGSIHQHCVFLGVVSDTNRYLDIQNRYVQQHGLEQGMQELWAGSPLSKCIRDFLRFAKLLLCVGGLQYEPAIRQNDYDTVHRIAMAFREGYGALVEHAYASKVRVPQGIFGELLQEPNDGVFNVPSNDAPERKSEVAVARVSSADNR